MTEQLGPTIEAARRLDEQAQLSAEIVRQLQGGSPYSGFQLSSASPVDAGSVQAAAGVTMPQLVETLSSGAYKTARAVGEFPQGFWRGVANATGGPQMLSGKPLQKETKTVGGDIGESVGALTELATELVGIERFMVAKGLVPLGKTFFPTLARAVEPMAVQEASRQARLAGAEAVHGGDLGAGETWVLPKGSVGAVVESTVMAGLLTAPALGIAKVWRSWRPAERVAAARILGVKVGASDDELAAAFEKQKLLWQSTGQLGVEGVSPQQHQAIRDAVVGRYTKMMAAREKLAADSASVAMREPLASSKLKLDPELTKPLTDYGLSQQASFELAKHGVTSVAEAQIAKGNSVVLAGTSDSTLAELNSLWQKLTKEPYASPDELLMIGPRGAGTRAQPQKGWKLNYLLQQASDTGGEVLPADPELRTSVLASLQRKDRVMRKWQKGYGWLGTAVRNRLLLPTPDGERMLNSWTSFRWAMSDLDDRAGVPVAHLAERVATSAQRGQDAARQIVGRAITAREVAGLTKEDNKAIVDFLFSPETRAQAAPAMSDRARALALKLQSLYQGDPGKQVQQNAFYNWSERGKMPSDIWRVAGDRLLASAPQMASWSGTRRLAERVVRDQLEGKKLTKTIKSIGLKYKWSQSQQDIATAFFSSGEIAAQRKALAEFPKQLLEEGRQAWAKGELPQWIAQQPRWGLREFYYMTQRGQQDAIDEWIVSAAGLKQSKVEPKPPGTIASEARARKSRRATPKEGSVVLNTLRHFEKLYTFNATHDDLKLLYSRLQQVPLTSEDWESIAAHLNNVLGSYQPEKPLGKLAAWAKGRFYRGRLSYYIQPGTLAWSMARDAPQALVIGAITERPQMLARMPLDGLLKMERRLRGVRSLEAVDPEMAQMYARDFRSLVSNKLEISHEHLMIAASKASSDFKTPELAARAGEILQRSTGAYTSVDEVSRSLMWARKYQEVKKYATMWRDGSISLDKFWRKTGLETLGESNTQQVVGWLSKAKAGDASAIPELSALAGRWTTDGTLGVYKTGLRSSNEQSLIERAVIGTIVFPRTVAEQTYYRGVVPMLRGMQAGAAAMRAGDRALAEQQFRLATKGALNLIRGVAVTTVAGNIAYQITGQQLYNIIGEVFGYQPLDPGTGSILKVFEVTGLQIARSMSGQQTGYAAAYNIADAWATLLERWFAPLSMPVENVLEARRGEAGHTLFRYLTNGVAEILGVKGHPAPKVRRTPYQAKMHAVTGRYEYPVRKKNPWTGSTGSAGWQ